VRLPRHIALCLLLLLPLAARADDIGPDQAKALQQQLKDWFASLLPGVTMPDTPLQITGEGDHYRVTWPIPGLDSPGGGVAVTALVKPLDGGRWSIDALSLPDTANFTVTVPDAIDKAAGGPTKVEMKVGKQDSHGVIDPALTTPSTMQFDARDLTVNTDSPTQHQEQRIDRYAAATRLQPTANGRLDLDLEATMEGWKSAARVNGNAAVAFGARQMNASGKIDGVNRDRVARLLTSITALIGTLPPDVLDKGAKTDLPAATRAQLHELVEDLADVLTSVRLQESVDGLQVEVAGMGGVGLQHLLVGFGGEAPDGRLHIWFDIGLDGLNTPSLPPAMTAFLPHHVALRPSLSGVQTADITKLALDATAADADTQLQPDIDAIFAHGGVDVGLETLAFDIGPAKLEGVGHLVALSEKSWRGEARLSATGFDQLTEQAKSTPELQQALPFLVMLRGLARPDGERLVWNVVSEAGSLVVNGMDLSQLGGGKPRPKRSVP
jgi:hypothetical protein